MHLKRHASVYGKIPQKIPASLDVLKMRLFKPLFTHYNALHFFMSVLIKTDIINFPYDTPHTHTHYTLTHMNNKMSN